MIDEVGYLSYGTDVANVLFQVVNDRHLKKRTMVFTTNKPIEAWGKALHDPDLAEAILDRVLERGRVLPFKGPSYRTRHLQGKGVPIVSGKSTAEFQEPTSVTCGAPELAQRRGSNDPRLAPSTERLVPIGREAELLVRGDGPTRVIGRCWAPSRGLRRAGR